MISVRLEGCTRRAVAHGVARVRLRPRPAVLLPPPVPLAQSCGAALGAGSRWSSNGSGSSSSSALGKPSAASAPQLHDLVSSEEAVERNPDLHYPPGSFEANMVQVPEALLSQLLQTEATYIGTGPVRPVSLREILDTLEAPRAAKFIHRELPKRLAVRLRMIENLAGWQQVHEFVRAYELLNTWYRDIRLVRRSKHVGLQEFITAIRKNKEEGAEMVQTMVSGMHKLRLTKGFSGSTEDLDRWLDDFFMIRIGSNTLIDQCIAVASEEDGGFAKPYGIVDTQCNAPHVCRQAADYATKLCVLHLGRAPEYSIETFVTDIDGKPSSDVPQFSYVPSYLRYMMIELLKNAFKATVERSATEADLQRRPVRILVSCDPMHCAIRVSDQAGGIPFHVGQRIWSYLYGAAVGKAGTVAATPLAGWGVGLPISRLHARYLGGKLTLHSYPGYGTDASLNLPTISSGQVEHLQPQR